jgi:predicted dithiol-disulfide oxidoreductase (DUF899 family)
MSETLHSRRFPGEDAAYRQARNELLAAEIELRKNIEAVSALRRQLPPGGLLREDYVFTEGAPDLDDSHTVRVTRLSSLFAPGKDTLVVYSYMFGPNMNQPCVSCTSILDSLNGTAQHATQRINLVVVAKSPLERIRANARSRGWNQLRLLSSHENTYNRDYHGETADGSQLPSLNVFVRCDGQIRHFYHSELLFAQQEPGMDARHVDLIWPLWNLLTSPRRVAAPSGIRVCNTADRDQTGQLGQKRRAAWKRAALVHRKQDVKAGIQRQA